MSEGSEEGLVARLDGHHGPVDQRHPLVGGRHGPCPTVGVVGGADQEVAALQGPDHLGGHHGVGAGVVGQLALGDRAVGTQPGEGGQEHELDVGEVERPERGPLGRLPPVGDLPEEQAGAVLRPRESRGQPAGVGHRDPMASAMHWKSPGLRATSPRRSE